MKEFLINLFNLRSEITHICPTIPEPVIIPKTNGERLYDFSMGFYSIDPTPKDIQPDGFACVESLTTILDLFMGYPLMTYTPTFLEYIKKDIRFKPTTEFKKGVIIISPTGTGNGKIVGHTGIIGENGKILSNSSLSGLWFDKFDQVSWIERYSRQGNLSLYLFELV